MKKILVPAILVLLTAHTCLAQIVQLRYTGNKQKIIEAVALANRILANEQFQQQVAAIATFDNTTLSGQQVLDQMKAITTIEVTEYYKKHTKTTAKTQTRIRLNTAKLGRPLTAMANTLVHETVHAVDWNTNARWDYTHRTQFEERPPVSAPYIIGAIAERMAQ